MPRYRRLFLVSAIIVALVLLAAGAAAETRVRQIIDAAGDGAGNTLEGPHGICADHLGNVYVTGTASNNVFKITPSGTVVEILGPTGDGAGHTVLRPRGIAVDAWGNVYVASTSSHYVFRITPAGAIDVILDSTGDGAGHLGGGPWGVAVDAARNVYVTCVLSNAFNVFKITPQGVVTWLAGPSGDGSGNTLGYPKGIAVDDWGNVYVTGSSSDNAFKITPGNDITEIIDATGDGLGHVLEEPEGVAVDGVGNVYVTAKQTDNVFKIASDGSITQIIDSSGDGLGNGLDRPWAVASDSQGHVVVSGQNSNNAFRIEPDGTIVEILDSSGDGLGHGFSNPLEFGVFVTESGQAFATTDSSHSAFEIRPCEGGDADSDGILDGCDNCPATSNATQTNDDRDPAGNACDCSIYDPTIYPGAPEINDGVDNQCPGDPGHGMVDEASGLSGFLNPADKSEYCWDAQEGATLYEVWRSTSVDFAQPCVGGTPTEACWIDATTPAVGGLFCYLNRPSAPHVGSWGRDSTGVERVLVCP